MPVMIGPFDPLQMIFGILNTLIDKGVINDSEAEEIIRKSLNPKLSEEEKNKIIESLKQPEG